MAENSDNSDDSDTGLFDEVLFDVNEQTLDIVHHDSVDSMNQMARRRTYRRADYQQNNAVRLNYETELYVYLTFHVRAFLLRLLSLCQMRLLVWISAGIFLSFLGFVYLCLLCLSLSIFVFILFYFSMFFYLFFLTTFLPIYRGLLWSARWFNSSSLVELQTTILCLADLSFFGTTISVCQ